jgi:signal transduction histidine kinase
MQALSDVRDVTFLQAAIDLQKGLNICSIDRNYICQNFNEACKTAISGAYKTEIARGANLLDVITNEGDRRRARAGCDRALAGEMFRSVAKYGAVNVSVYETLYLPIVTQEGEVIGVAIQSSNISEKVHAEQKIENLTKELESFTYTAAHDLRVPLRVMDGYAKILGEDYRDVLDEDGRKLVGIISTHATRMGQLIDDLLSFAQFGRATVVPRMTNIRDIVQQVIDEQVSRYGDERTRFALGELPSCNCDPALIRVVLTHLISNAVKFSLKNENPVVEIGSIKHGPSSVYFVKDNGVGFNMEYSAKLFGLFQRLHKPTEFEGTGVGLAIVQRIVGKHGGAVWFEAELNKGATFYFSL